ncbi:hypothetical protein, partial [Desulfovibrio sp.]|uniref:hypothetical protein n=1 Tax=Desulfovibrio sp. TaxID=885 RepID=UPI003AB551A5
YKKKRILFFLCNSRLGSSFTFSKKEILAKKNHSARINLFFGAGLAACSFFVFRVDWVQARSGARVDEHIS